MYEGLGNVSGGLAAVREGLGGRALAEGGHTGSRGPDGEQTSTVVPRRLDAGLHEIHSLMFNRVARANAMGTRLTKVEQRSSSSTGFPCRGVRRPRMGNSARPEQPQGAQAGSGEREHCSAGKGCRGLLESATLLLPLPVLGDSAREKHQDRHQASGARLARPTMPGPPSASGNYFLAFADI